jgi:hypothetical protein
MPTTIVDTTQRAWWVIDQKWRASNAAMFPLPDWSWIGNENTHWEMVNHFAIDECNHVVIRPFDRDIWACEWCNTAITRLELYA